MAEYIDRKQAENAINLHRCDTSRIEEAILHIPSANVIPIPDEATNGDMIKAMFPNGKYETNGNFVHVYIQYFAIIQTMTFDLSWWNAPYKKVR